MPNETLEDLQAKLVDRVMRHLKMDGAYHDVTNKKDKSAKKDLEREIEHLVGRALSDYEDLRERYDGKKKKVTRRKRKNKQESKKA